ncbi:mucin-2-like isoform X3 [Simochromis diagramma]|uniref:mucin-2-like isoform X3 n=1 Tax=Simochromis diagramma TaxID=43689 RepID=UPI001A7EB975|nr:mucin-2-like isoform X3 [Simochromis diagramma]
MKHFLILQHVPAYYDFLLCRDVLTFIMPLSALVLMLLVCSVQANFYSIVVNYYPRGNVSTGSSTGILYYKLGYSSCLYSLPYSIGGQTLVLDKVDEESRGEWCQTEGVISRLFSSNSIFSIPVSGIDWIFGIKNGIVSFKIQALVELRIRSDIGKANTSPQTTIIPAIRVPSNCPRNLSLLMFDPDGDIVKCRNGDASLSECSPCTPPSVLSLSPSCTLSFSPTNSSNEGSYVVQLVMEDFPRQTITLTQTNGTQTTITTNDAISKIPIQFALKVDPAVPSCTEGLFLPKFLPPTPANGAQLYNNVSQTLEINITAEALNSTIFELLYSGPYNLINNTSGPGQFTLRWTPSESEEGQSLPICFVVQAVFSGTKYHSELRCVTVTVANGPVITTTTTTSTPTTVPATTTTSTPTTEPATTTTSTPTTVPATTTTSTPNTVTPRTTTSTPTTVPATTTTSTPTTVPATTTTSTPNTVTPRTTTSTATTEPATTTTSTPSTTLSTSTTPSEPSYVAVFQMKMTSLVDLSKIDRDTFLTQIKNLLISKGLPQHTIIRLISSKPQIGAPAAPSTGTT